MNALLTLAIFLLSAGIIFLVPADGASALLLCGALALLVSFIINRIESEGQFLLRLFIAALLIRLLIGTIIFYFHLQNFFGPDALTYDAVGGSLLRDWQSKSGTSSVEWFAGGGGWGMIYMVGAVYAVVGRNLLAIQFVNSIFGAASSATVFLCAWQIFRSLKVARLAAILVAFFPSLVLWSAQGLKDAPIVFLLTLAMLATLKLNERFDLVQMLVLICALCGLLSLRFYIFYMVVAAIGGGFIIGSREVDAQSLFRQFVVVIGIGLALMYLGVLRTASTQLETFGSLEAVQRSRLDLAQSAQSGYGKDVDVSTTAGALTTIPIGTIYLLFAPFPWQLANLRQSITLPEMLVWWASFPLLILGLWFTIRYRLRPALPIMLFTTMLTFAYAVFQGNVGTAYRQRAQLLVFYFIFVAVGFALLKERREDRRKKT